MAARTPARAVEKLFASRSAARAEPFGGNIVGIGAGHASVQVKESEFGIDVGDEIGDLGRIERKRWHPAVGSTLRDNRRDQIATFIMANQPRTYQIGAATSR